LNTDGILNDKKPFVGPSYRTSNRLLRLLWSVVWLLLCRCSPRPLHRFRLLVLRAFGAQVSLAAYVYPDTKIWAPWNLRLARHATLGPGVNCYNPSLIELGERSVVSQGTHLCTASHDYNDPAFQLFAKPIRIAAGAWVAAECFIGPGVTVGEQAILGARTVLFHDAPPHTIWVGNPAIFKKHRPQPASGAIQADQ
jgi:putative colanic acid biosynthesis acetyltransferase WcaF